MSTIEAEILHGAIPVVIAREYALGGPGELDTLTVRILSPFPDWQDSARECGFVADRPIAGNAAMFVGSTRLSAITGKTCELEISCTGLVSGGDKRMRKISCGGQQVSVGPWEKVIIAWDKREQGEDPEGGPVEKVKRATPKLDDEGKPVYETIVAFGTYSGTRFNIHEPVLTVTDTYYSQSLPSTAAVGTATGPPNAPQPPAFIWDGYPKDVRVNAPSGWVLTNREIVEIGPGLWSVTDTFQFYQAYMPD